MTRESEEAGERALDTFKQRVFASAFGSPHPKVALDQFNKLFETPEPETDYDADEFIPETEADVQKMLNEARRLGAIQ